MCGKLWSLMTGFITHTHARTHARTHSRTHTTHAHAHAHTHTHTHTHAHAHAHTRTRTRTRTRTHAHTHTHTHTSFNLPEQGLLLQVLESLSFPEQASPPYLGSGLVHVRLSCCCPPPHVTEHVDDCVHELQPPATAK